MRYFKYFDIKELFAHCSNEEVIDCLNQNCFDNLLILLEVLDALREFADVPIIINSSFRSKAHNDRVGGVSTSQHLLGQAIDFTFSGLMPSAVKPMIDEFFQKSALKKFVGQVIIYKTFIHIGLRTQAHKDFIIYDKRNVENNR